MKDFIERGSVIDIILENDKVVKVSKKYVDNMIANLDVDLPEALEIWLEDEGYLINEEQEELCKTAKDNRVLASLHRTKDVAEPKKKTQKERVAKENPTKEMIISAIAGILPNFAENINVENKGKIITFTIGEDEFKIDLIQKRKKKN